MNNWDYECRILFYKGLYHYLGKEIDTAQSQAGWSYWDSLPHPRLCWICGQKVNRRDRSIDHIIPKAIIHELSLPGLIYDKRNFRIAHKQCNGKRGDNIDTLPKSVKNKLLERREILYANRD